MEFDKLMKQSTEIEVKVNTLNKSIGETTARIEGGKSPIKNLRQWKSIKFLGTLGTVFSVVGALQLTRSTQKDMRFLAHLTRAMKRGDYKEVARISHNAKKADHIVNDMLRFSASAGGIGPKRTLENLMTGDAQGFLLGLSKAMERVQTSPNGGE